MEAKYNMPVRASYQTANKVGAMSTSIDPLNPEALKNIETVMLTMARENFRIQISRCPFQIRYEERG